MKLVTLVISLLIVSCAKTDLVHFANNFEVIAQTDNALPTLSSRLLRVRDFGECDQDKCPGEVIYITVSEFGEYPEQSLYVTKKANKWQFVEWNHIPELGESDPTLIFTLKRIDENIEETITVKANLSTIEYINKSDNK